MTLKRETFLSAAAATIAAASGMALRLPAEAAAEFGAGPEFEPWLTWNQDARRPLATIRAAILSANAWNTQPWLFHVTGNSIDVYADTMRNLGAFDPYRREMYFSLGCALENLMLASAANGFSPTLSPVAGELRPSAFRPHEPVASIVLTPAVPTRTELYNAIPHRHTNRNPYEPTRAVPDDVRATLDGAVNAGGSVRSFLYSERRDIKRIVDLIVSSSAEFGSDPNVGRGTRPWIRTSEAQERNLADGVLAEPTSAKPPSLQDYRDLMLTAPLFGIIAVRDRYDRIDTLSAGRTWQRAHLLAVSRGLAARPANGAIELIDHQRATLRKPTALAALARITGDARWQPTFMFYMGYAAEPAIATPRRPVSRLLVTSEPANRQTSKEPR